MAYRVVEAQTSFAKPTRLSNAIVSYAAQAHDMTAACTTRLADNRLSTK
jgi:hypothetical protein